MDDVEIPKYFICPISLQIMKDPVTTVTAITYDRESIERWRSGSRNQTCPVTNQPLSTDSVLTPNHTLRRLIQSWCAAKGIAYDQIMPPLTNPPPRPINKHLVITLLKNLKAVDDQEAVRAALEKLEILADVDGGCNIISLQQAGVDKAMVNFIKTCHKNRAIIGLKQALSVLYRLRSHDHDQTRFASYENEHLIDVLAWVLGLNNEVALKIHAVLLLKLLIDKANAGVLERLRLDFFENLVLLLKERSASEAGIKAVLEIMLSSCALGRNRTMMVETGAVFELIELGLASTEKSTTELIFGVLVHLCSCADGRDQLLSHGAGLAFLSENFLKISPKANDRIMFILSLVSMFSGTSGVLREMLRLGIVNKLCTVLQYNDRSSYLKDKAKEILRSHLNVWKNADCIEVSEVVRRTLACS